MFKWLRRARARMGVLQRVRNSKRRFGSAKGYFCVKLQQTNGTEGYYLFTNQELKNARIRALTNREDIDKVLPIRDWLD